MQGLRKLFFGVSVLLWLLLTGSACQAPDAQTSYSVKRFQDLARKGVRIGIVDPDLGPAGRYAVEVIKKFELSDPVAAAAVNSNIVTYESQVRALIDKLVRREVDAGFVYRSDILPVADKLNVVEIPAQFSVSPEYAMARIKGCTFPDAALNFMAWLRAPALREIWLKYGFNPPKATPPRLNPASSNSPAAASIKLSVFAGAVFYDVLQVLAQKYMKLSKVEIVCEFAGSGKLYQKIEQGAQGCYGADIFLSAAPRYVIELENSGLADHRQIFMRNELVVGVAKP